MSFIRILVGCFTCWLLGFLPAQAMELEYKQYSLGVRPYYTHIVENNISVYGFKRFQVFTEEFDIQKMSGPHHYSGIPRDIKFNSKGEKFVVIRGFDGFQAFDLNPLQTIFLSDASKGLFSKSRHVFDNAASYGFEIAIDDTPVLLTGDGNRYELSIFNKSGGKIERSTTFGAGKQADFVISESGNYSILGYDKIEKNKYRVTYWEFDENLNLIKKIGLGRLYHTNGDSYIKLLKSADELFAVYGWGGSIKEPIDDEKVWVAKLPGVTDAWSEPLKIPYMSRMRTYVSPNGELVAFYPGIDTIQVVLVNPKNKEISKGNLQRPSNPVQCFPPKWKYSILDILQKENGDDYMIFIGNPLNHTEAGCVSIAQLKW